MGESGPGQALTAWRVEGNGTGGNDEGPNGNGKGNATVMKQERNGREWGNGQMKQKRAAMETIGAETKGGNKAANCCVERQRLIRIAPWR